jgi:hypothetical protein
MSTVERLSLLEAAKDEVRRHKWIRSEQVGCDLGRTAVQEWLESHWRGFARARLVEHCLGIRYWSELSDRSFGVAQKLRPTDPQLLEWLLQKLREGAENLEILVLAQERGFPSDQVIQILEMLDIDAWRVPPDLGGEI